MNSHGQCNSCNKNLLFFLYNPYCDVSKYCSFRCANKIEKVHCYKCGKTTPLGETKQNDTGIYCKECFKKMPGRLSDEYAQMVGNLYLGGKLYYSYTALIERGPNDIKEVKITKKHRVPTKSIWDWLYGIQDHYTKKDFIWKCYPPKN